MTFAGERPIVCLITSGESTHANFPQTFIKLLDLISAAAFSRVSLIQIREKQLDGKQLFELVSKAVSLTKGSTTKLVVNGRTDVAVVAGADGVHLPSDAYSSTVVREMAPSRDFLVGVSTHSIEEIETARNDGADYVVLGPIFDTPGKTPKKGIEILKQTVVKFPDFPILGLGGIDEGNVCEVLDSGAAGFAAIRYLSDKENLRRLDQVISGCKKREQLDVNG